MKPILNTGLTFIRTGMAAMAVLLAGLAGNAQAQTADATYIGEQACIKCHQIEDSHFKHTPMAKAFRLNPKNEAERNVCEACHGPGSLHAKSEKDKNLIISFTKGWGTPVEKQVAQCQTCHKGGNRIHWEGSAHASQQMSCTDCHNPMAKISANGLLKKAGISETCLSCHTQQRAEFMKRSHKPVLEGKMACADCHNPHGTTSKALLKTDTVNETCYSCHAEKRGPMIWEHAPVRESCLNCHNAHGSNHDKLLAAARPFLCQQCHANTNHPSAFYNASQLPNANGNAQTSTAGGAAAGLNSRVMGRSCVTCHAQIHGSNHPAGARFQR